MAEARERYRLYCDWQGQGMVKGRTSVTGSILIADDMKIVFRKRRATFFIVLCGFLIQALIIPACIQKTRNDSGTEIIWDHAGVPHIYGETLEEMYFGFGYAQMEHHSDLILRLYGKARGRAAEYWGGDYVESDIRMLLFEIPEQANLNLGRMELRTRQFLESFVEGINRYALEHPEQIGEEVRKVLPVTARDVMAHVLRVICLEFIAYEDLYVAGTMASNGSNAYAIGPSRSASGNAMLVTNPHLPWWDLFLWFEAHLVAEDFNAYGISLVGMPTLSMAFNQHLGWALTVNTMDGSDRYKLTLADNGYLLGGRTQHFVSNTHTLKILQPGGTWKDTVVTCRKTVHGPVIEVNDNTAIAIRLVGMENDGMLEQFHRMSAATGIGEFEEALKMLQVPMFNMIYADRSGNILYVFNGNVPARPGGDYSFWKGTLDGSDPELIWNRTLDYDELPRVLNPPGGFIQNCNDPPWTCTYPPVLERENFPPYVAPDFMHFRAQRATNMILGNPSITFEDLVSYKLNTGVETAERFLDDLLAAVEVYPDSLTAAAAEVLRQWDKKTESGSRGAVLFTNWFDRLDSRLFSRKWDPELPHLTPDGINDPATAAGLLQEAARDVLSRYGSLEVAWGEIHRFQMNHRDMPANGGPERYGIFRTIDYRENGDHKKIAVSGDTYVAVIEFGEKVKAEVMLSYGNSSMSGNPHYGDQIGLLSDKKLRPALLEREKILQNVEKHEHLSIKNPQNRH